MTDKNQDAALTKAEKKRAEAFEKKTQELLAQGYVRHDLTADPKKANVTGSLMGFLLALPFFAAFVILHWGKGVVDLSLLFANGEQAIGQMLVRWVAFLAVLLALIVVHELVHGLFFGLFAKDGFRSVAFGVKWKSLNPYCTCCDSLRRRQYMISLLAPCVLLGIVPMVVALFIHSVLLLFTGVLMTSSAGGDLLIASLLLRDKPTAEALYYDHPTAIGVIRFDRDS